MKPHPVGAKGGWNGIKHTLHLAQWLAHSKCSIKNSHEWISLTSLLHGSLQHTIYVRVWHWLSRPFGPGAGNKHIQIREQNEEGRAVLQLVLTSPTGDQNQWWCLVVVGEGIIFKRARWKLRKFVGSFPRRGNWGLGQTCKLWTIMSWIQTPNIVPNKAEIVSWGKMAWATLHLQKLVADKIRPLKVWEGEICPQSKWKCRYFTCVC